MRSRKFPLLALITESRRAYVKIEARILARLVREGITFVLFATDIPSIIESFGVGALAGKSSRDDSVGVGEARAIFQFAVSAFRRRDKKCFGALQRVGREFRQRSPRIRTERKNDFWRRAQE
jgi:hypothetical protein